MDADKALTPKKQKRFCQEYLVDLNATGAARWAGYSAKTAHGQGPRLLANTLQLATAHRG
ncbi:MAG TPA: terminase small subunit [Hyphomicrobiaceae bacterium]|nr:terminase small subunit [Hyphomicrobiaceae bacterium]